MSAASGLNSCHSSLPNTKRLSHLWVQDGWMQETEGELTLRVAKMKSIKNPMTMPCQYRHHVDDPKCKGCNK